MGLGVGVAVGRGVARDVVEAAEGLGETLEDEEVGSSALADGQETRAVAAVVVVDVADGEARDGVGDAEEAAVFDRDGFFFFYRVRYEER